MRVRQIALVGTVSALALSACTSTPEATEPSSLPSGSPPPASVTPVVWSSIAVPSRGVRLPDALQRGGAVHVELMVDEPTPGTQFQFVVRLKNHSPDPVPLSPCPPYRVQLATVVEVGLLNCSVGPDSIPPDGYVDYAMEVEAAPFLRGTAIAPLLWQLGSEGDEGPTDSLDVDIVLDPSELGLLEVVRTSTYPTFSPVPEVVQIRAVQVATQLACALGERVGFGIHWYRGPKQPAEAALWLTRRSGVSTALLVRQTPDRGVVLLLDRKQSVTARIELMKSGHRWYAGDGQRCVEKH